jgi:hypothetical protein
MMKKLLVLALVLGMATLANATLTNGLTLNVTGTAVTVTGTSTTDWDLVVISNKTLSPLDASALNMSVAPSMSGLMAGFSDLVAGCADDLSAYTSGAVWTITSASGETYKTGTYLTLTSTAGATVTLAQFDEGTTHLVGMQTIVPEPMTMALLGLGGLFLRRRK